MSLLNFLKAKKYQEQIAALEEENRKLNALLSPEQNRHIDLQKEIEQLERNRAFQLSEIQSMDEHRRKIAAEQEKQALQLQREYESKRAQLIVMDEQILLESFALYQPRYSFQNSESYKNKLDEIRLQQKEFIKRGNAASGNNNWTVNNSKSEGKKLVNDTVKLLLRAFNNECDFSVDNVKFNNIDSCEKRIVSSYDAINKLGRVMNIHISPQYLELKKAELYLAYEYQLKKQEEKEEQKMLREQMREEARLQKEIEEVRKLAEKEKKHYQTALAKALKQLEECDSEEERLTLGEKIASFEQQLGEIEKQLKEVDYREANQRAGYVYIISNIGAFGENVFKIGMTRRLDPFDRVNELGDASVPFNFDVHAMIFSDDAPKLEAALHKAFEKRKLNAVNARREFFNVTLDEIEDVIRRHHDKSVEFVKTFEAEQYRESLLLRGQSDAGKSIANSRSEAAATRQ